MARKATTSCLATVVTILLIGEEGNDQLSGGPGSDRLEGGAGDDSLAGGDGLDFAMYGANRGQFTVEANGEGIIVRAKPLAIAATGQDELSGIERILFANINLAFDFDGAAGIAAKVLGAFVGRAGLRVPETVGLVLDLLDNGMSYAELLQLAVDTVFDAETTGADMVRHYHEALTGQEASGRTRGTLGRHGGQRRDFRA